jgi:hypothetical protein
MVRSSTWVSLTALALAMAAPAEARQAAPVPAGGAPAVLLTSDAAIEAALDRIASRSGLWRAALADVAVRGRRVFVLTPDQVVVSDGAGPATQSFDASSLAEVSPVVRAGAAVDAVLVVVNVALLADLHHGLGTSERDFEQDLERVLIHEVYGHAIPYLQAGDTSGRCADPERGHDPEDACSVRRENEVRAEAGLGRRREYALGGLVVMERLARASAHAHASSR